MSALWRAADPLILASRSAARRALLAGAAIPLDLRPADLNERALEASLGDAAPGEIALFLARAKAQAAAAQSPGRLVLGADQTLSCGARVFAKPASVEEAREQLMVLRGRTHALHSAVALVRDGAVLFAHVEAARLVMRDFSADFLDRYLDAAGPAVCESVGAYQLEGAGAHLFERIEGDYFTILGLPLLPLLAFLRRDGVLAA